MFESNQYRSLHPRKHAVASQPENDGWKALLSLGDGTLFNGYICSYPDRGRFEFSKLYPNRFSEAANRHPAVVRENRLVKSLL